MSDEQSRKAARVTEDCFALLVRAFLASPKFKNYSASTQNLWGRELNLAARPDCLGALSLQVIRPALVQAFFDGLDGRPGKQEAALAAMRQLEKWALVRDLLPRAIATGIEIGASDGGHMPWSDEHVALAHKHARADLARAVVLAANTGQRGSDLIRMGPTDLEIVDGIEGINVVQLKTGVELWVPITEALADAMATWERRAGPYLLRPDGRPWRRHDLTQAWKYERDHNPHLAPLKTVGLVLHGLRGHACVALKRKGCNTQQIAGLVGMSEKMVERYTRKSSQKANAVATVHFLARTRPHGQIRKLSND